MVFFIMQICRDEFFIHLDVYLNMYTHIYFKLACFDITTSKAPSSLDSQESSRFKSFGCRPALVWSVPPRFGLCLWDPIF